MTTTEKKYRPTAQEKRCIDFIGKDRELIHFTLQWTRGNHVMITSHQHGRLAHAGGGGYCKESAALADVCRWLLPADKAGHLAIHVTSGCGVPAVIDAVAKHTNYQLKNIYAGHAEDGYTLELKS